MESITTKRRREMLTAAINFTSTPIRKRKESLPDFLKELKGNSAEEFSEFTNGSLTDLDNMRPPTKRMKKFHIEENSSNAATCCYSNPALDLQAQDRTVNPFEVMRTDLSTSHGLTNPALEFDVEQENEKTEGRKFNPHVNLFEVFRKDKEPSKGIDNYALEINSPEHKPLVLALPFQPTVNHRIDFSNMPNLLPFQYQHEVNEKCQLPVDNIPEDAAAEHLSMIKEEESEVDIGRELDNYQLELENSMNEAKIKKMNGEVPEQQEKQSSEIEKKDSSSYQVALDETECNDLKECRDDDVQFEEVDSFEDYGNFKRAYRKENVNQVDDAAATKAPSEKKRFTTIMRNSVRKLIKSKSSRQTQTKESHETKENNHHLGLIQTIRQSLRRKNRIQRTPMAVTSPNQTICENRKVYKEIKTIVSQQTIVAEISASVNQLNEEKTVTKKLSVKTKKTFQENVEIFDNL